MKIKSIAIACALLAAACTQSSPNSSNSSSNSQSGGDSSSGGSGNGPTVRYIGRVDSTTPVMSWPGTAVQTVFTGTTGTVTFTSKSSQNYVSIIVDGGTPVKAQVSNNTPISLGTLASGTHTVTVVKITEGGTYGTMQLAGFQTDGKGGNTTIPSRKIEFIGDSITAGYGVDGTDPCTETPAVENASNTYAWITGQNLNADVALIAWSGKGVYRNAATNLTDTVVMPDLWLQTSTDDKTATWSFPSSSIPDAVVINLGTNDFSYMSYDSSGNSYAARSPITQDEYVTAMTTLIQNVQAKYPSAQIFLCSSPMLSDSYPTSSDQQHTTQLSYLNQVASAIGSNVHVVDFPTQETGTGLNGCDSHPSAAEHKSMATVLTAQIKSSMGW